MVKVTELNLHQIRRNFLSLLHISSPLEWEVREREREKNECQGERKRVERKRRERKNDGREDVGRRIIYVRLNCTRKRRSNISFITRRKWRYTEERLVRKRPRKWSESTLFLERKRRGAVNERRERWKRERKIKRQLIYDAICASFSSPSSFSPSSTHPSFLSLLFSLPFNLSSSFLLNLCFFLSLSHVLPS